MCIENDHTLCIFSTVYKKLCPYTKIVWCYDIYLLSSTLHIQRGCMQNQNTTINIPKYKIAPFIQPPNQSSSLFSYYTNFKQAKDAFDDEDIQKYVKNVCRNAYHAGNYANRVVLLQSEEEVYLQAYNAFLDIIKERGLVCENFENSDFNVKAWLYTVFLNRSKDELRRKVPRAKRESIEPTMNGFNSIIYKFSVQATDIIEYAEVTSLKNWFSNICPMVLQHYSTVLNTYKTVIHKLIYNPETISITELQNLCTKNPNIRNAKQALRIIRQEYIPFIEEIESCGELKSHATKDWAVYILFGTGYISFDHMLKQMPAHQFKKIRENNIRRTLNRAESELWMVITKLLLWISPKEGYHSVYKNMVLYALKKARLHLPTSRKDNFIETAQNISNWIDDHVHENIPTSFRYVKMALGILCVDNSTQTLNDGLSEKEYDALMVETKQLHKLAVHLCACNIPLIAK